MKAAKTRDGKSKLSMVSTLRYFLKGNMLFAVNGIVIATIDSVANIFPSLFQQVYTDNIITRKSPEWFTPLLALYIMIFLIELSTWVFFSILRRNSQAKISITSSSKFLWTVLCLPMTRLSQFTPGELVARYTTIPRTIRMLDYNLPIICCLILPVVCCYVVMLYNWQLGLLELFSILLLIYVMRSTAKMQKKISMDLEVTDARLQNVTMTGMSNLETIKSLGCECHFFAQWEKALSQSMNARVKTTTTSIFLNAMPQIVLQLTNGVILCLGAWYILQGEMTPGMILASQGLINESIYPINRAIDSIQNLMRLHSSILRVKDVTDCSQESIDLSLSGDDELPDVAKLTGEIELRDVTFGYDRSLPPILNHFSLKIKAGEHIALVGPSGCGKSTLMRLMLGLEHPLSGSIFYDQYDLSDINLRSLRRYCIGICMQDGQLVEGTIRDNIIFSNPLLTDDDAWEAARQAALDGDIRQMPLGMDTPISVDGKGVSGGQRQRILIARALVRKPTVLFLDEATSALDNISQHIVIDNLAKLKCTRIVIAHRLSTIQQCNRIIVLKDGRVADEGTFEELQARGHFLDVKK